MHVHNPLAPCGSLYHVPPTILEAHGVSDAYRSTDPRVGNASFCVSRHPLTRAISEFLYERLVHGGRRGMLGTCDAAALNDWVLSTYEPIADELNKLGAVGATYSASFPSSDAAAANCHLLPQVRASNALTTRAPIALCPPCLMPAASRAACAQVMYTRSCDTVLALESLASDFAALMRAHNDSLADVDLDSVHINPATVVNPIAVDDNCTLPVSALNARSKALLERAYRTDLTELGYEPEPALTSSCSATKRKVTGSSTGALQQVSNIIKRKQICASEVVRFSLHDL